MKVMTNLYPKNSMNPGQHSTLDGNGDKVLYCTVMSETSDGRKVQLIHFETGRIFLVVYGPRSFDDEYVMKEFNTEGRLLADTMVIHS